MSTNKKKVSFEEFLTRLPSDFFETHSIKDVSQYKGYNSPLTVICHLHGEYTTRACRVGKCRKCYIDSTKTKVENFISAASAVHKGKYDYAQVVYSTARVKVDILCPRHGPFRQTPDAHLRGQGCRKCGFYSNKKGGSKKVDHDSFILKCKKEHKDRYDYTNTIYTDMNSTISVVCEIHGEFKQNARVHYRGSGCKECSVIKRTKTFEEAVDDFRIVHGDKYSYEKGSYKGTQNKLKIFCPAHGCFEQTAVSHLAGAGCKTCGFEVKKMYNPTIMQRDKESLINTYGELYVFYDHKSQITKVGVSKNSEKRVKDVRKDSKLKFSLVQKWSLNLYTAYMLEDKIHRTINNRRAKLPKFSGYTECFSIKPEEVTDLVCYLEHEIKENDRKY